LCSGKRKAARLVQWEKKCNFIVIYLTFQNFYFFVHC
jgi:hypothetical protein